MYGTTFGYIAVLLLTLFHHDLVHNCQCEKTHGKTKFMLSLSVWLCGVVV